MVTWTEWIANYGECGDNPVPAWANQCQLRFRDGTEYQSRQGRQDADGFRWTLTGGDGDIVCYAYAVPQDLVEIAEKLDEWNPHGLFCDKQTGDAWVWLAPYGYSTKPQFCSPASLRAQDFPETCYTQLQWAQTRYDFGFTVASAHGVDDNEGTIELTAEEARMNKYNLSLKDADAVVLYKAHDHGYGMVPFEWAPVDKRLASYMEVRGVRISYATGRPLADSKQRLNCGLSWRPVSIDGDNRSVPYDKLIVKVEPFDLHDLETTEKRSVPVDIGFEEGNTIIEEIEGLKNALSADNIPLDAKITQAEGNEIFVLFDRPETLKERTTRLYRKPALAELREQKRQHEIAERRAQLLAELDRLDMEDR